MRVKKGDIVEGTVTGITKYGAFVSIDNMTGMIHISEISREYVTDINSHLKINQKIKAVVIGVNEGGRLALSIKRIKEVRPADFEDLLSKFKQDSDERIADLKLEAKRAPRHLLNKKKQK